MLMFFMFRSSTSDNAFHVLIDLIQNDLWWVVVLHLGTSYFTPFVLLDDLVHLVVLICKQKDELIRPLNTVHSC